MKVVDTIAEMKRWSAVASEAGEKIALVPTMGALHQGHIKLFERAAGEGDKVVATIFVNPTQFGEGEDFSRYPKRLDKDIEAARGAGVDLLFTPTAAEIYPEGFDTSVEVGELSTRLCGAARPGHFSGVATVVLKLFNIIAPGKALFGLKDYQQFLVIKEMVRDLNLDVELVGVETVREADGLAISSRNSYLNSEERRAAAVISASLELAREAFARGVRSSAEIASIVEKSIEKEALAVIDYISVCDALTLADLTNIEKGALLAVAVRIGPARLIDNVVLGESGL